MSAHSALGISSNLSNLNHKIMS